MIVHILPDPRNIEVISKYKENMNSKKEKIIACLAGGGIMGAKHVGQIIALDDLGILPLIDEFCGTSIGAINSALFSKYIRNIGMAEKIWRNIKKKEDFYDRDINVPTIIFQALCKSESILYPRGLYNILDKEFGNKLTFDYLPIPVTVSSVDIGVGDLDGGLANNDSVSMAIKNGATKVILMGCFPDAKTNRQKFYNNKDNVVKSIKKSSALPVILPCITDDGHKVDMITVAKNILQPMLEIMEEKNWEIFEYREILSTLDPIKYPNIEKMDLYPKTDSKHDILDINYIGEDIEEAYKETMEKYNNPDELDKFLNK